MKRASSDRTETVRTRLTETWDKTQIKKNSSKRQNPGDSRGHSLQGRP